MWFRNELSSLAEVSLYTHTHTHTHKVIQGEWPIFCEVRVCQCEKKKSSHKHVSKSEWLPRYVQLFECGAHCSSLPLLSRPNSVRCLFVGVDEKRSLQKKSGYTRRTGHSHIGCCCPHKKMWRSTQTNNTRSSHASCKLHYSWRWVVRTFIVNCNKFI